MAFTVSLENPPGTPIPSNELIPGQALHISCKGGLIGGNFFAMTFEPINPSGAFATIQDSGYANTFTGNWDTDIVVPSVVATAHLRLTRTPSVGSDEMNFYLGIGELPPPIPKPISWQTVLLWTGVIVGVGLVGYAGYQLFRKKKPQQFVLLPPPKSSSPS